MIFFFESAFLLVKRAALFYKANAVHLFTTVATKGVSTSESTVEFVWPVAQMPFSDIKAIALWVSQ